jgi:sarcosine oxidase subunit gamma
MVEPHLRQHALAHRGLAAAVSSVDDPGVRLWLHDSCVQLCLRGDGGRRFSTAVSDVLGVAPPKQANTVVEHGGRRILWLGPDEWLVVGAGGEPESGLPGALEQALEGQHALVSDVSHSRVILVLEGRHAGNVLRKGCSLDLDPVAFAAGQCAQAPLARSHMLLHQVDDRPTYHVYFHRSFADYGHAWLTDAAAEYGLATTPAAVKG